MNCAWIQRLISVHRELDRPERLAVAAHLRVCDDCQAAWRDELRIKAMIASIPDLQPPPGLEARLLRIPDSPPPTGPTAPRTPGPGLGPALFGPARGGTLLAVIALGASLLAGARLASPGAASVGGPSSAAAAAAAVRSAASATVVARLAATQTPSLEAASGVSRHRALAAASRGAGVVNLGDSARGGAPAYPRGGSGADVATQDMRPAINESSALPAAGAPEAAPPPGPARVATAVPPGSVGGAGPAEATAGSAPVTGGPMPATVDQTPAPCARLSLHAFADVAGTGPLDCGGCDGQYDAADAELAASNGVRLAPFRVQLLDSGSDVVYEGLVIPDGPSVWVALPEVCGAWPVRARVAALGGDWAACPSSGGLEREIASGGTHSVSFPLTSGCAGRTATAVVLTPSPVATLIPTDAPDPVGSPSPQTGPGGHATAELDVTPTLTAQTDPTGPPTREPAPSPTASPTESIEVVATPALRFHPSPTPTPTPEVSTPGPPASWLLPSPTATKRLRNPGDPSRGQP